MLMGNGCLLLAAENDIASTTLDRAREVGRKKSDFLKEKETEKATVGAVPTADLTRFEESIGEILKKNCFTCHGPLKSEGGLRIDKLDPNLLAGPDADRWREIYRVLSNSEMPPKDKVDGSLADVDRTKLIDWLSEELNKEL